MCLKKNPVPMVGELILYNEKKCDTREDDGYVWHRSTSREFARVSGIDNRFVILQSVYSDEKYIFTVRKVDFILGLYYYIVIKQLPDNCESFSWHEKEIEAFQRNHPECLNAFEKMLVETSAEYRRE